MTLLLHKMAEPIFGLGKLTQLLLQFNVTGVVFRSS